ncbi:MAG: MarR family transcriptional regulator [Actinomycetota bacterium]|nr:MarR family transcriptional regulator [Actinomycetota bacterium]
MPRLDAARVAAWHRLQRTAAEIERLVDADVRRDWDVPLGWFDVLAALAAHGGGIRPSGLAAELRTDRSSLSRRLDRLAEEGWIRRRPAPTPSDHRVVLVELTPRGRNLWREMNVSYRRSVQARFATRLTDADVADLSRILRQIEP